MIEHHAGQIIVIKKWDKRKLAYEIKGQKRGLYIIAYFTAPGAAVAAIERDVNLSEQVLRVLVTGRSSEAEEMAAVEPQPIPPPKSGPRGNGPSRTTRRRGGRSGGDRDDRRPGGSGPRRPTAAATMKTRSRRRQGIPLPAILPAAATVRSIWPTSTKYSIGNLTRDPQLRICPSQTAVVGFGMAMNRKYKAANGEDREEVCFVDCSAFGKQAETINQYCQKGKRLHRRPAEATTWEDKQGGGKRSKTAGGGGQLPIPRRRRAVTAAPVGARMPARRMGDQSPPPPQLGRRRRRSAAPACRSTAAGPPATALWRRTAGLRKTKFRSKTITIFTKENLMPNVKLLLNESVKHVGKVGDVVEVSRVLPATTCCPKAWL